MRTHTFLVSLLAPLVTVYAQLADPNIVGTWSSGSKNVVTGPGFANPANTSFNYPKTTGVSFSFSDDNFYEIARYRFNGNGSEPNCITAVIGWVHGTYEKLANGSIVLTPFGDGYQQVQDPCAAQSNFMENYNQTELLRSFQMFRDPTFGLKLHLFQFDGAPIAPLFQVSTTPTMHPTRSLRNVTPPVEVLNKRSNGASPAADVAHLGAASSIVAAILSVTFASLAL
ncbi:hypothetical protein HGRIS_005499 [Hohenbuehelia grisea]|uniref:Protein ROT1 n=1 Tax=Hohenbuehelia grisea TaxID=104357 RepID=A0ABR3JY50_9AGAR